MPFMVTFLMAFAFLFAGIGSVGMMRVVRVLIPTFMLPIVMAW